MSDRSGIEWTEATWNPVTGCTKVSPGCDHCYAETFAERFRGVPGHHFEAGFDVTLRPERLGQPARWRKPRRVFVNSMSDLFHRDVPDQFIVRVFAAMASAPRHTFQLLTKRHGRMLSLLNDTGFVDEVAQEIAGNHVVDGDPMPEPGEWWPLPNLWLGVSVEDQKRALLRIPALRWTPAAVRWVSCEPLLGDVDLVSATHAPVAPSHRHWPGCDCGRVHGLDWVVVGGESGHGARVMNLPWARHLVEQCRTAKVPVFVKQLGSHYGRRHHDIEQFPPELWFREYPTVLAAA